MKDQLISIGGKLWEKGDKSRVYFNNLRELAGLELSFYGTGNVSYAKLDGEKISNRRAKALATELDFGKFWWDAADELFHGTGMSKEMIDRIAANLRARIEGGQS